ncbi:MAG: 2Fe-2S iron-sulfur cluster-binding protein [Endozoicomonas sp. (ex Botrylloides leachii)]|nr:2Fe-2S iron-sulfur cluster-binding protein [Endozoicomonas sp. (ex Botrylloides leachii)]
MPEITVFGNVCWLEKGENLLDGLLKKGIKIPYSCQAGVCHSCLLRLKKGQPPKGSQDTLNRRQIEQGYILACRSQVIENLHVGLAKRDQLPATVVALTPITSTVLSLVIAPRFPIHRDNISCLMALDVTPSISGQCRIHMIDSSNNTLIFQIERKAGDAFSSWVHESASTGDQLILRFPCSHSSVG